MTVLESIVRELPTWAVVEHLNAVQADLDEWAANGFDVDHDPDLRRERARRDALRAEYRRRTGEVV